MHTKYNQMAVLKRKMAQLEDKFKKETSDEKRRWIFWEIEQTYREMDRFLTSFPVKKNP